MARTGEGKIVMQLKLFLVAQSISSFALFGLPGSSDSKEYAMQKTWV